MPGKNDFTIAVFGESDTLNPAILAMWKEADVLLKGPYPPDTNDSNQWNFSSALVDVRYSSTVMAPLMDELEARAIPYIFFVPLCAVGSEKGPFVLSDEAEDIQHIVSVLVAQGRYTKH